MRRFLGSALLLLATIAFGCSSADNQPGDPLPVLNEIASMDATFYDPEKSRDITFAVPQAHWSKIRDALVPAKRDGAPAKWVGVGGLVIKKKVGGQLDVWLFSVPHGPGAFAIGQTSEQRVYYRGGESVMLMQALRAAYEATRNPP